MTKDDKCKNKECKECELIHIKKMNKKLKKINHKLLKENRELKEENEEYKNYEEINENEKDIEGNIVVKFLHKVNEININPEIKYNNNNDNNNNDNNNVDKNNTRIEPLLTTLQNPPYDPSQICDTYGITKFRKLNNVSGKNQVIAIVNAYSYDSVVNDFTKFCKTFNLTVPKIVTIGTTSTSMRNAANTLKTNPPNGTFYFGVQKLSSIRNKGWALEQSLDIQWAHVIAPLASIVLIQARSASYTDMMNAVNNAKQLGATVISMSWGSSEFSGQSTYNTYFDPNNQMNRNYKNITYVASAGDAPGVSYPSASPFVLSVGGTTLSINKNVENNITSYSRNEEKVWYNNSNNSTGQGMSAYESLPSYQSTNITNTDLTTPNKRITPDITFNADPNTGVYVYNSYYNIFSSGWYQVGGTSFSAPVWAGIIALVNELRIKNNKTILNNKLLCDNLYKTLKDDTYQNVFFDINSGTFNNEIPSVGYDKYSGLGSPLCELLLPYLALV